MASRILPNRHHYKVRVNSLTIRTGWSESEWFIPIIAEGNKFDGVKALW